MWRGVEREDEALVDVLVADAVVVVVGDVLDRRRLYGRALPRGVYYVCVCRRCQGQRRTRGVVDVLRISKEQMRNRGAL